MATWDGSTVNLLSADGGVGLGVDSTVGGASSEVLTRRTRSGRVYAEFETPVRRSPPPAPKRVKFVESGSRAETLSRTQEVNLFNADRRGPARFTPQVEEEFGNVTPEFLGRNSTSESSLSFLEDDEAIFDRARLSIGRAQSAQDQAQEIISRMDSTVAARERFLNKTTLEDVEAATPLNPTPHPLETTTFSTPFPEEIEATAFSTPLPDDTTSIGSIASSSSGSTSAAVNAADVSAVEASGLPVESNVSSILPVESGVSAIFEDPLLLAAATGVGDISTPRNTSLPEDEPLFPSTEEDAIVRPKPRPRSFGSLDRHSSPNVSEEGNNAPRNQNKLAVRGRRLFRKTSTLNTTPEVSPIPKPAPRAPPRIRGILRNSTFADSSFSNTVIQDQENATIGHLGNSTTVNSENFRPPVNSTNAAEQSTLRAEERSAARTASRAESSVAAEESALAGGGGGLGGGLGGILLPLLLFSSLSGNKGSSQPAYVPSYAPAPYTVPPPPNVLHF